MTHNNSLGSCYVFKIILDSRSQVTVGHNTQVQYELLQKTKRRFHLLLLLMSSTYHVCCWTIIVHRQYTGIKDSFLKVCVLLEWLWGSTWAWHRCAPTYTKALTMRVNPKHIGQRNHLLPSSDCTYSLSPAGGAAAHWGETMHPVWVHGIAFTAK